MVNEAALVARLLATDPLGRAAIADWLDWLAGALESWSADVWEALNTDTLKECGVGGEALEVVMRSRAIALTSDRLPCAQALHEMAARVRPGSQA